MTTQQLDRVLQSINVGVGTKNNIRRTLVTLFKWAPMIRGNPKKGEVYGYTGWANDSGYLSLHNPSDEAREFQIVLDRALGLPKSAASKGTSYLVSSPLAVDAGALPKTTTAGQTCTVTLPPRAIRILEFTNTTSGPVR